LLLSQLKLLITLSEKGSLRAAAEVLNVTQPALSKSLRNLEESLGTTLVQRSTKGVRLTTAGELLTNRAVTALRELERAREDIAWHTGSETGKVTVGVSPAVAILFAPGAATRFHTRWPNARLCIRDTLYPQALRLVRMGELDFVLGPMPASGVGNDLLCEILFHSQEVIAARKNHPLSNATRLRDLNNAHWILTGPSHGPGDPAHLYLERQGLPAPRILMECESFSTLLGLMPTIDAIGIMPSSFLERYGRRTGLIALPIQDPLPITEIYAVSRADTPLNRAAQDLFDAFLQEAKDLQRALQGAN